MASKDFLDEDLPQRRTSDRERRWPPVVAVVIAAGTYALLPEQVLFGPRYVIPAVEVLILVALLIARPRRLERPSRLSRTLAVILATVMIAANMVALGTLVSVLPSAKASGRDLLVAAMQVWVTNVIGFALLYWELDRGGPVARRHLAREQLPPADWRFSHDENDGDVDEVARSSSKTSGWIPAFIDYLYMSLTNSSAFSPTDTMPLSPRAKVLMGVQATAALLTALLVTARAVGSFGGGS